MKKIFVVCSMMILSLFCVGCEKTIELTEEESHHIAEYAAELLIKYDRNLEYKYHEAIAETVYLTTEEVVTEATDSDAMEGSSEATTEGTTEEAGEESSEAYNPDDTTQPSEMEDVQGEELAGEISDGKNFDVGKFVGEDNVSIKYSYYMLTDSYPSYSQDGMYIEIEAPAGYKLLVLKFDVENKTSQDQTIDLYNKDIGYNIIVNDTRSAKQMLTILIDDLYTYQKTIGADMREEAVVLFQVSDSVAESIIDLKLQISHGNNKQIITIE